MGTKNAVERRLDLLHDQWTEFAGLPGARLLRWVVEEDEVRMVEAFLEKEGDERIGECPDLFLRLDAPFDEPSRHGYALREALAGMVEESRAGLEAEAGLTAPGVLPPVAPDGTDVEAFLKSCESLHATYASVCEHLVVVLVPAQVSDAGAWLKWLWRVVEALQAPHVRLVVLDDASTLALEPLAQALPEQVVTMVAGLEMGRALEELSQEAGHLDTPGGRFRDLFVRMGNAAKKGNPVRVEKLGARAVALASEQGWHALVVAARFVMAAALLADKRPEGALAHYRQAEAAAAEAEAGGDAQGPSLRLKARMAQGAALVAAQAHPEAAKLYAETAPLAHGVGDALMELECWRMASWCCEVAREVEPAWEHGQRAWQVGQAMDARARAHSTLPYVGEALVRLSHERQGERAARDVESEVASVLGEGWRPRAAPPSAPAAGGQAS